MFTANILMIPVSPSVSVSVSAREMATVSVRVMPVCALSDVFALVWDF